MSLTLRPNPVVRPQLLHGDSLPGVHSEKALGETLGLTTDIAPWLSLKSEVALLDPPHHVAGGVCPGPRVEWRPATQHRKLKIYRMRMTAFLDFVSLSQALYLSYALCLKLTIKLSLKVLLKFPLSTALSHSQALYCY